MISSLVKGALGAVIRGFQNWMDGLKRDQLNKEAGASEVREEIQNETLKTENEWDKIDARVDDPNDAFDELRGAAESARGGSPNKNSGGD